MPSRDVELLIRFMHEIEGGKDSCAFEGNDTVTYPQEPHALESESAESFHRTHPPIHASTVSGDQTSLSSHRQNPQTP